MKIVAYVDVYPHSQPGNVVLINQDNAGYWTYPTGDGKRYRITFDVPDPIQVDGEVRASVAEQERIEEAGK